MNLQRNDTCPCDSGKKYKKCCLNQVEEFYRKLQEEDFHWITPSFKQAISLLCGMRKREEEIVPDYAQVVASLDELDKNFFNPNLK